MSGDCENDGLLYIVFPKQLPNCEGGLEAIKLRHVAVHEDQLVTALFRIIVLLPLDVTLDHFDGALATQCTFAEVSGVEFQLVL